MEDQEETEIARDIAGMARIILGSGMQAAEQMQRHAQLAHQEREAQGARERALVEQIRRDFSSAPFWKDAGSESVADRMTVLAELANRHPEAARTYMDGADRIRNRFGINIEDINRDHPTAPADRHAALRDALDDYLASHRLDAESRTSPGAGQDAPRDPGKDADTAPEPDAGTANQTAANRAAASSAAAGTARENETANLGRADDAGAETNQDRKNAETQEHRETPAADQPAAPSQPGERWQPGEPTPGAAQALKSWRETTGGKGNPNFPDLPSLTNSNTAMKNRKRVLGATEPNRTQEKALSR